MTTPIGPDFIALQSARPPASSKFYVEIFGFKAAAQSPPGAVVLKTRPIPLALREPLSSASRSRALGVGMVPGSHATTRRTARLIVKRGGAILSQLADGPSVASSSR